MMEDCEATQEPTEGAPALAVAETSSEPPATSPPEVEAAPEGEAESSAPDAGFAPAAAAESIVLSSEGLLRWLGDPVARVVAGDSLLQPHAVLLADEALSGEDRGTVETRVSLWLAAHLRKVLGPLLALGEGADLSNAARALGGKIAEALGVLDRDRVRTEVKALDQTARGALRKLGVRFGSLYIYVPARLKPGARGLCSLLWTLRRGSEAGADRLLALAAAGRTSFANEGLLSPDSYRVAGFRLCGERVVRVDIIERLSDLIRAAIPDHMRFGSRPASEAYGFLVTPQMTSLTGCSGEAFASILRSLGFEPVKVNKAAFEAANRKAPTEPIKPAISEAPAEASEPAPDVVRGDGAEAPPVAEEGEIAHASDADSAPESRVEELPAAAGEGEAPSSVEPAAEAAMEAESAEVPPPVVVSPEPAALGLESEPAPEAIVEESPAPESQVESAPAEGEGETLSSAEPAAEAPATEPTVETVAAAAEDEEIEIWRPAPRRARAPQRPHGEEREGRTPHPGKSRDARRQDRPATAEAANAGEAASSEAPPRPQGPPRGQRPERREDAPRWREAKGKEERARDDRRPPKELGPRREARPTPVDPDSPFAKLAALKPLLERRDKRP